MRTNCVIYTEKGKWYIKLFNSAFSIKLTEKQIKYLQEIISKGV